MRKGALLLVVRLVAAISVSAALGAEAQIERVTIAVDGMACPFCAYGVEKRLRRVDGVGAVTISMKQGTASLSADKGESIRIGQVPRAVKDAGFTPGVMRIVAAGTIRAEGGRLFVRTHGEPQELLITNMDEKIRAVLRRHAQEGTPVTVKGVARRGSGGAWTLWPEAVQGISQGEKDAE